MGKSSADLSEKYPVIEIILIILDIIFNAFKNSNEVIAEYYFAKRKKYNFAD